MSKEEFFLDKKTQQAVILNLILIGEEATKLLKDDEVFTQAEALKKKGSPALISNPQAAIKKIARSLPRSPFKQCLQPALARGS